MTFTDAAAEVLRQLGRPLHYKEITEFAIEKNLLSHVGKSPEVTMGARLAALFKKDSPDNTLVRVKPGVFALKEWEDSGQLKQMLAKSKSKPAADRAAEPEPAAPAPAEAETPAATTEATTEGGEAEAATPSRRGRDRRRRSRGRDREAQAELPVTTEAVEAVAEPVAAAEPAPPADVEPAPAKAVAELEPSQEPAEEPEEVTVEAGASAATPERLSMPEAPQGGPELDEEEEEDLVDDRSPEEIARAQLAASAAGVFEEEDDDDLPIFAGPGAEPPGEREGRRRRRRRRRGGKEPREGNGGLPAYSVSPAFADASHSEQIQTEPRVTSPSSGPVVLEVSSSALDSIALDDFGGKDMADAIAIVLSQFDRSAGPVSLRQIAEAAQKRARLGGDLQQVQSQIAAAVRADNMRRTAQGQRPRFRVAGGRIAMTDWLLGADLARLEQEAISAVERYREAARRAFVRKIQELPGHAFVELVLLTLERIGFQHVRAVRRAGVPGNEAHFAAIQKTGAIEIPTALIIRRDGREIGRERVAEVRGSLHHYGPAAAAWIITSGQVLSGAREEAGATATSQIALLDGSGIARLCEKNEVAVILARLPVAIPDVDLLEALRAS